MHSLKIHWIFEIWLCLFSIHLLVANFGKLTSSTIQFVRRSFYNWIWFSLLCSNQLANNWHQNVWIKVHCRMWLRTVILWRKSRWFMVFLGTSYYTIIVQCTFKPYENGHVKITFSQLMSDPKQIESMKMGENWIWNLYVSRSPIGSILSLQNTE